MASQARTLGQAARVATDRINGILAKTVTQVPVISFLIERGATGSAQVQLSFRQRRSTFAPILTAFGWMELFVGQVCEPIRTDDGSYALRILQYRYAITPRGAEEPVLRWEFVREPADPQARWCRAHLQGTLPLELPGDVRLPLNAFHLPTGRVPIEEVLRFCIVDLGVRPLSSDWHEQLERSRADSGL